MERKIGANLESWVKIQMEIIEMDRRALLSSLFKQSATSMKLLRMVAYYKKTEGYKEYLTEADWTYIVNYLERVDGFPTRLSAKCPSLATDELRLCYLLRLDLPIVDISVVVERRRDSVYKRMPFIANKLDHTSREMSLKDLLDEI